MERTDHETPTAENEKWVSVQAETELPHNSNTTDYDSILYCPICLDHFSRPAKNLSCGHTFCLDPCLRNLISRGATSCPLCRNDIIFPSSGNVDDFPSNFIVNNMIDAINERSETGKPKAENQSMCLRKNKGRDFLCLTCNEPVCSCCLLFTHRNLNHNFVSFSEFINSKRTKLSKYHQQVNEITLSQESKRLTFLRPKVSSCKTLHDNLITIVNTLFEGLHDNAVVGWEMVKCMLVDIERDQVNFEILYQNIISELRYYDTRLHFANKKTALLNAIRDKTNKHSFSKKIMGVANLSAQSTICVTLQANICKECDALIDSMGQEVFDLNEATQQYDSIVDRYDIMLKRVVEVDETFYVHVVKREVSEREVIVLHDTIEAVQAVQLSECDLSMVNIKSDISSFQMLRDDTIALCECQMKSFRNMQFVLEDAKEKLKIIEDNRVIILERFDKLRKEIVCQEKLNEFAKIKRAKVLAIQELAYLLGPPCHPLWSPSDAYEYLQQIQKYFDTLKEHIDFMCDGLLNYMNERLFDVNEADDQFRDIIYKREEIQCCLDAMYKHYFISIFYDIILQNIHYSLFYSIYIQGIEELRLPNTVPGINKLKTNMSRFEVSKFEYLAILKYVDLESTDDARYITDTRRQLLGHFSHLTEIIEIHEKSDKILRRIEDKNSIVNGKDIYDGQSYEYDVLKTEIQSMHTNILEGLCLSNLQNLRKAEKLFQEILKKKREISNFQLIGWNDVDQLEHEINNMCSIHSKMLSNVPNSISCNLHLFKTESTNLYNNLRREKQTKAKFAQFKQKYNELDQIKNNVTEHFIKSQCTAQSFQMMKNRLRIMSIASTMRGMVTYRYDNHRYLISHCDFVLKECYARERLNDSPGNYTNIVPIMTDVINRFNSICAEFWVMDALFLLKIFVFLAGLLSVLIVIIVR